MYAVSLPSEVSYLLKMFSSVFSISIASFGLPLGCLNLASFFNKLIFMMLFPVVLCLLIVLGCVVSSGLIAKLLQLVARVLSLFGAARPRPVTDEEDSIESVEGGSSSSSKIKLTATKSRGSFYLGNKLVTQGTTTLSRSSVLKKRVLVALPAVLVITFIAFPVVSALAFQGLNCEEFEDTRGVRRRYLKADYAVDCDDELAYGPVLRLSWIAIVLYPVGVPLMYMLLLHAAKGAIKTDRPT